ncbi:MAG TPA: FAD-binding oxidoreductase [bacterium]|nr:FAD-binding oxidoreductase [bacterium]
MTHEEKVLRIAGQLRSRDTSEGPLSLQKASVSHFVPNPNDPRHKDRKINVRDLNQILKIDPIKKICVAEPGVTFVELVARTLELGLAPMLVPELKTITIGGAVSGCSVESMSYKYGGFHDSCLEYEVITAAGEVLACSPQKNADVFHMIHGSYGTLGIISKLTFKLIDAKPFVRMDYINFPSFRELTQEILRYSEEKRGASGSPDFIDAIVHGPDRNVLCLGTFVDALPPDTKTSDYTWLNIFYKSTREKTRDYLKTSDYFFRYDTECHWLSRTLPGMESKLLRLLLGKLLLGSTNLLTWSKRLAPLLKFDKRPDVVVDVFIPVNKLEAFYARYREKVGYYPLWIVPYKRVQSYPWIDPAYDRRIADTMFFDVAVYGLRNRDRKVNYYKILEDLTLECNGIKTLISHNSYDRETFWTIYNRPEYEKVKKRTDPKNFFRDLYDKFHFSAA